MNSYGFENEINEIFNIEKKGIWSGNMLAMFLDAMQWDKSWNIIAPSIGKTALIYCTHTTLVEREREDGHSAKKLDFWSCRRGAEYVINKCINFCSYKLVV